jgi:hypothetical protein
VFKGKIKKIDVNDNVYECTCVDKLQELKYKLFTKSYDRNIDAEAGEVTAIFKDIAEDGGFTVSTENSGTAITDVTLDKFRNRNDKRLDRLYSLSSIIDWVFFYDYDNDWIRHEPKGFIEYSNLLNVGTNVINIPLWEENIENMRNVITVAGATQLDTRIESFTATADTEFQLTYSPVSIEVTLDGNLKVLGVSGGTASYDYTLDVDLKKVVFTSAQTGALVVKYTAKVPTPITGKNVDSINTYNVEQEELFTFDDIATIADAEARLQQLLTVIGQPERATTIFTTELNIKVGNKINYQNVINSAKDGAYVVSSIVMNYGLDYDVIKIGTPRVDVNKIFMSFDERLKYIEGTDTEYIGILRRLFNLSRTYPKFNTRYFKKQKISLNGTPIYDTSYYYDADVYYDDDLSTTEDVSVIQGNNTYKEYFYDTDFFDSDNSTGDWNTTNEQIELDAFETVQSESIFKNKTQTFSSASISATDTGDVVYQISGDGLTYGILDSNISFNTNNTTITGNDIVLALDLESATTPLVIDFSPEANNGTFKINATAYYPFNGNANDESVNSNDGTVTGATLTTDHLGNENNAYGFASGDYIDIPSGTDLSTASDFTFWFYGNSNSSSATKTASLISWRPSSLRGIGLQISSSGIVYYVIRDPTTGAISSIATPTSVSGLDCLLVATYISSTNMMYFYLNGTLIGSTAGRPMTTVASRRIGGNLIITGNSENYTGKVYDVGVLNGTALTDAEVLNLYNYTSVHKLDKPLVTKTDSDGNSITGYELTGQGDEVSGGGVHWGTYVELPNLGIAGDTTVSYYGKFYLSPELITKSDFIVGARWGDSNTISVDGNKLNWRQDDTGLTSDTTILRNKIYQYVIMFEYDSITPANSSWTMVIADANGTIVETKTSTGYDAFNAGAIRLGYETRFSRQMRGVISKPLIFNRILTEAERTALFNGQVNLPFKGNDIKYRVTESKGSTATVSYIEVKNGN